MQATTFSGCLMQSEAEPRDARSMNHMDPQTKLTHLRLESWGRATRGHEGVGWPAATLLARMIEQGPMGASQQGRPPVDLCDRDAKTDAAVARLGVIDQKVARDYYQGWFTISMLARRHRMRERQVQNILRRIRDRVGGFLAACDANNLNALSKRGTTHL